MENDELFANFPRRKRNRLVPYVQTQSLSNEIKNVVVDQTLSNEIKNVGVEQSLSNEIKNVGVEKQRFGLHKKFKKFKKLTPPIFDGKMDPLEAVKWLEEMEMMFEVLECDDKEKIFFAVYQLQGNARYWWKAEKMTHEQDTTAISWNKFKDLFYSNYFPTSTRQRMEVEFVRLEQGSMTVSEYRAKFLELVKFVGGWIGDEMYKTRKFEMGLQPRIRQIVVPFQLDTFSAMVEKSLLIERELNIMQVDEDEQMRKQSFSTSSQGSFTSRNRGKSQMEIQRSWDNMSRNSSVQCSYCHKGHETKDCRWLNGACIICGKYDHQKANCPQQRGTFRNTSREFRGPPNQNFVDNQSGRPNQPQRSQARVFSMNKEQALTSNTVVLDEDRA